MALFTTRPRGYKIGFLLILLACGMALFGVVAPGWLRQKLRIYVYEVETYFGLWFYCSSYLSGCDSVDIGDGTGLYIATIVLSTSSVVLLFIASLFGLVLNCCASVDTPRRTLQFCSIWGGCKLFVACMLFVGDYNDVVTSGYASYGPSFIITVVASILAVIGGVLVSANSNPVMPFTSFVVGPNGVTPVQQQFGTPVQPAYVYYSGSQVSYMSNVAVSTGVAQSSGYTGPQYGSYATQEVNGAYATQEVKKGGQTPESGGLGGSCNYSEEGACLEPNHFCSPDGVCQCNSSILPNPDIPACVENVTSDGKENLTSGYKPKELYLEKETINWLAVAGGVLAVCLFAFLAVLALVTVYGQPTKDSLIDVPSPPPPTPAESCAGNRSFTIDTTLITASLHAAMAHTVRRPRQPPSQPFSQTQADDRFLSAFPASHYTTAESLSLSREPTYSASSGVEMLHTPSKSHSQSPSFHSLSRSPSAQSQTQLLPILVTSRCDVRGVSPAGSPAQRRAVSFSVDGVQVPSHPRYHHPSPPPPSSPSPSLQRFAVRDECDTGSSEPTSESSGCDVM